MSESYKTSFSQAASHKFDHVDKITDRISIEKMQSTIEMLIADNRKRDQSMDNASSIIDSVYSENQKLRSVVQKRSEVIEEQKRQIRELEDSKMKLRNEARESKKLKTIETRLRSDLNSINLEKQSLKKELDQLKKDHEMKIEVLGKDIEHEKLMKQKILNDFSEINKKEQDSTDLLEDYVLQIREYESENENMKKEVLQLKDFRNNLIEKHAQEIKSIQENARRAIERLKDSQKSFNESIHTGTMQQRDEGKQVYEAKYKLMAEIATEAMQSLNNFSVAVGQISQSENEELENLRKNIGENYEKEIALMDTQQDDSILKKEIEEYEKKIFDFEEIIATQQNIISGLNIEKSQLFDMFRESLSFFENSAIQDITEKNMNLDKMSMFLRSKEKDYETVASEAHRKVEEIKNRLHETESENRQIVNILVQEIGLTYTDKDKPLTEQLTESFKKMKEEDHVKYETLKIKNKDIVEENIQNSVKLQAMNEQLKDRIENLQEEIRAKNEQIDEMRENMTDLIHESQEEQMKFTELGEELIQKSVEVETISQQCEELQNQNQQLIQQVNKLAVRDIMPLQSNESHQQQECLTNLQYENQKMKNKIINLEFNLKEYQQEIIILKDEIVDKKEKMGYLMKSLEQARIQENNLKDQIYVKRSNSGLRSSLMNSTNISHMSKKDHTLPTNLSHDFANTSRLSMDMRRGEYDDVDLDEFQRELMEEDFDQG